MGKARWEGFESREDSEKLRNYLLQYLPGLIKHLLDLSITQKDLADDVGVSKVTVNLWLQGKRKPTLKNMAKMIEAIEKRMGLIYLNLDTAKGHLEMLRQVQENLEQSKKKRGKKGK